MLFNLHCGILSFSGERENVQIQPVLLTVFAVLSYVIPFITITLQAPESKAEPNPPLIIEEAAQQITLIQPPQESFNWMNVIGAVYILITLFLLIRSILSLFKINKTKGEKRIYQNYNMVLTKMKYHPSAFGTPSIWEKAI